jgi:urease accessory protein UreH
LFQYHSYSSRLEVYHRQQLIVWDQFLLEPTLHQYQGIGAMEHYTYSCTFWIISDDITQSLLDRIRLILPVPHTDAAILGGASFTASLGIAVRMLGHNAWQLQELVQLIWDECRNSLLDLPPCHLRK